MTIFSILSAWICLILHIMIVLMVLDHLTSSNYLTCGQNYAKCRQLCRKKQTQKLVFCLFFDFETLNILDFADYDTNNCCSSNTTGNEEAWAMMKLSRFEEEKKLVSETFSLVRLVPWGTLQFSPTVSPQLRLLIVRP